MSKVYSYKDYDKYLCLKVDLSLWVVILFLLRPYVLLASSFSMGRGGGLKGVGGLKDLVYPDDLSLIIAFLATIPVMFFIYAWIRRAPAASNLVRKLWRHGKRLLVASALLGILGIFVPVLAGFAHSVHGIGWSQVGLSVLVILYLHFSVRANDVFADFPEEEG